VWIGFTACTQRLFLALFETYHTYSTPDPFSWQYSSTVVDNSIKIASVRPLWPSGLMLNVQTIKQKGYLKKASYGAILRKELWQGRWSTAEGWGGE
jgi:hypothetical protein